MQLKMLIWQIISKFKQLILNKAIPKYMFITQISFTVITILLDSALILLSKKLSPHKNFAVSWLRSEIQEIKMPPKILF